MMRAAGALIAGMLMMVGCGASQTLTLRVMDRRDGEAKPLAGALVRGVAMDTGLTPLPVTQQTINEAAHADARTSGVTGQDGVVRIEVLGDRPTWIEVERCALGASVERAEEAGQAWRWRWNPTAGALTPVSDDAAWNVNLEIVR